ncbi:MAG TPA: hypothetical protein VFF17_04275, partial [Thermoanaerobaculia bacterium]|nr:hypothetical protein [Thermoanaerobaculia bacterium]
MRPSFAARFAVLVLASLAASPAIAIIRPVEPSALQQKAFRLPGLEGATDYRRLSQVSGELAARLGSDLAALGVPASAGVYDLHTGRWVTLIPSRPLVPGSGVGNNLRWRDLGRAEPGSTAEIQGAAWSAFAGFLTR